MECVISALNLQFLLYLFTNTYFETLFLYNRISIVFKNIVKIQNLNNKKKNNNLIVNNIKKYIFSNIVN